MFISFNSGGKTLMKWREPGQYPLMRNFFLRASLVGLLLFVLFYVTKSMRETGHPFKEFPVLLFILLLAGALYLWLSVGAVVRLKEISVTRRLGKYLDFVDYDEIEMAAVHKGTYGDKTCSIIKFQVKDKPKSFLGKPRLNEIAVPPNVNLEQALRILRDKGVQVIQHSHA